MIVEDYQDRWDRSESHRSFIMILGNVDADICLRAVDLDLSHDIDLELVEITKNWNVKFVAKS